MTSAFQKSLRKEEDRIDRKRKENREAFEKFREMRIKNGDSVTAEDFQRYRQNLAGGDNFMLQSMGPGHMLEDIAKRTNEQSLLTRTKEDASFVEAQEKIKNTFDTFVGDNLDADPTDMNGSKKKFMALFNENPELGEEIWNQNKGRFSEALLAGRVKSAQEFHDLLLEDVHTKDEAQKIMIANGVPAWKQASIMSIMERKQNKFGGDTQSKAIELANGFVPNNVRFFDQMEIDKQVVLIMQRAKVDASIIGQTAFDDLKANITSVIKTKVDNANAAQIETDTRTFNQTISSNAMFINIESIAVLGNFILIAALSIYSEKIPLTMSPPIGISPSKGSIPNFILVPGIVKLSSRFLLNCLSRISVSFKISPNINVFI